LSNQKKPGLSIIIPVLNEVVALVKAVDGIDLLRRSGAEVIVVDGGSQDGTVALATELADRVLSTATGRAMQMNCGAKIAAGDYLLFLHADTVMSDDAQSRLLVTIQKHPVWGRFDVRLSGHYSIFRVVEYFMNLRSRVTGIATGDQAIFVNRDVFHKLGGYPEIPLMEDIVLSTQLRRWDSPLCIASKIISDSRRWESNGVIRTIVLMWVLRFLFFVGVDADKLASIYYR